MTVLDFGLSTVAVCMCDSVVALLYYIIVHMAVVNVSLNVQSCRYTACLISKVPLVLKIE